MLRNFKMIIYQQKNKSLVVNRQIETPVEIELMKKINKISLLK